jgi:hypothetical protein
MKKPIYLESTTVAAARTAGEVSTLLIAAGARRITVDYDETGRIVGMSFILLIRNIPHPFSMPVRTDGVFKILQGRRRSDRYRYVEIDRAQAERIAWRHLLRWIQVQLAMADTGMAELREVFLPYLVDEGGRTVFQYFEETRFKELPPAPGASAT